MKALKDITERLNRMSESQSDEDDEEGEEENTEGSVFAFGQMDDEELHFLTDR